MQFFMYVCMILISWIGAKAIIASGNHAALGMTTGDLTALLSYATQILTSLMMLSMVFVMITMSLASARRIAEVLNEKTDIQNSESPVMAVKDGSITFKDVDFVYASKADKKVLDHINLTISSGETVGIIGATGSSKSSLVQLIPRLYDVTGGTLTLGGIDVKEYDLDTLRSSVAMVLQKNELFSGTIKEICVGAMKMLRTKKWNTPVVLPVQMNLSKLCRNNTIPILSKGAIMFRAVKNSGFALPVHYSKSQRF